MTPKSLSQAVRKLLDKSHQLHLHHWQEAPNKYRPHSITQCRHGSHCAEMFSVDLYISIPQPSTHQSNVNLEELIVWFPGMIIMGCPCMLHSFTWVFLKDKGRSCFLISYKQAVVNNCSFQRMRSRRTHMYTTINNWSTNLHALGAFLPPINIRGRWFSVNAPPGSRNRLASQSALLGAKRNLDWTRSHTWRCRSNVLSKDLVNSTRYWVWECTVLCCSTRWSRVDVENH